LGTLSHATLIKVNKGEGGKTILEKMKKCVASIEIRSIEVQELNTEIINTPNKYKPKKERFQDVDMYVWDTETMDQKTEVRRTLTDSECRTNAKIKALGIT